MGKTVRKAYDILGIEKHPHVHGEDLSEVINTICRLETPPRAWGRHSEFLIVGKISRNTPTCMGKTKTG